MSPASLVRTWSPAAQTATTLASTRPSYRLGRRAPRPHGQGVMTALMFDRTSSSRRGSPGAQRDLQTSVITTAVLRSSKSGSPSRSEAAIMARSPRSTATKRSASSTNALTPLAGGGRLRQRLELASGLANSAALSVPCWLPTDRGSGSEPRRRSLAAAVRPAHPGHAAATIAGAARTASPRSGSNETLKLVNFHRVILPRYGRPR